MAKGEAIDFAARRAVLRPNELSFEVQEALNLCSDGAGDEAYVQARDRELGSRQKYVRDLGGRMLKSFMQRRDRVAPPIFKEFRGLSPDLQQEVQAILESISKKEGNN